MLFSRLLTFLIATIVIFTSQSLLAVSEQHTLSRLPQVFEQNKGQFDTRFDYIAQTPETFFAFSKDRVNLFLHSHKKNKPTKFLSMTFQGANKAPQISGLNNKPQRVNYIRGKADQWVQNVPTFAKIEYAELYPGINLQFHFNQTQMEFDFIVAPGTDPSQIIFNIENADTVQLTAKGELEIRLDGERIIQKAPVLYQNINGKRQFIEGHFKQQGQAISFHVGDYNPQFSLVIDPVIEFSSYWGGEWEDQGNTIKTDSQGNIFLAGASAARARITRANIMTSEAVALPTLANVDTQTLFQADHGISLSDAIIAGASLDLTIDDYNCDYKYKEFLGNDRIVVDYDAFISKFDSNFQPIFTTYFGGCHNDTIRAMVIDSNDNVYVTGLSSSENFPLKSPTQSVMGISRFRDDPAAGQGDAIYAKFDNDGKLLFSSFLGGDGQDAGRGITLDDNDNIYLLGYSRSLKLAVTPCGDTVIEKALFCENIGGVKLEANDEGSPDVSVFADVFIAKITQDANNLPFLNYLSYFGGKFDDWGQSIAFHNGSIYITGTTSSPDLPVGENDDYSYMPYNFNQTKDVIIEDRKELFCTRSQEETLIDLRIADAHICRDVFLAKITINDDKSSQIDFVTYFGGDNDDSASKIEVDSLGNIYLTGTSKSRGVRLDSGKANTLIDDFLETRFPLYKNINQYPFDINSVNNSAFLAVFTPSADELILSSFIGGNDDDSGNALVIKEHPVGFGGSKMVDIYLAGNTTSNNFYTTKAFRTKTIQSDAYLLKLSLDLSRASHPYDAENPDNENLCSANSCNLYSIKYSTLLGAEDLDSMKSMALLPNDGGLIMSGITFSRKLPLSSDALKTAIAGISLRGYDPISREIIDEYVFYPSDMFLLKLTDVDETVDLNLSLSLNNSGEITKSDTMSYAIEIENKSESQLARSVSLAVTFPYVAKLEEIHNFITIDAMDCLLGSNQIYCSFGDIAAGEKKTLSLQISARNGGNFLLTASVSSMTANVGSNIHQSITAGIKETTGGSLNIMTLLLLLIFGGRLRRQFFRD